MSGEWVRQGLYDRLRPDLRAKIEELGMLDDDRPSLAGPEIYNLDGISFSDYPALPPRDHQCWAQTSGWIHFAYVQRCPCGAIAYHETVQYWMKRNSTRDYYERRAAARAEAEGLQPPVLPVPVLARSLWRRLLGWHS